MFSTISIHLYNLSQATRLNCFQSQVCKKSYAPSIVMQNRQKLKQSSVEEGMYYKAPAHYDPEGSKPHESLQLVGTPMDPRMHAKAQNSSTSSPLLYHHTTHQVITKKEKQKEKRTLTRILKQTQKGSWKRHIIFIYIYMKPYQTKGSD